MINDPEWWVDYQMAVEAVTLQGRVFRRGRVIAYADKPTFVIEDENGERFSWVAELTRPAT